MEQPLPLKDFIGERGFNKLVSSFREEGLKFIMRAQTSWVCCSGARIFCKHGGEKERNCYIRGKWISFEREEINKTYNLKEKKEGSKFKKLVKEPNYQKIVELLTDRKGEWNSTRKNPYESITRGSLIEEAKNWFFFLDLVLLPSKHLSIVRKEGALLLYAILKGYKPNVGNIIKKSILNYYSIKFKGLIPCPTTIIRLCILEVVKGTWEEEERCPKTSPLTLTSITKPQVNKGKKKM